MNAKLISAFLLAFAVCCAAAVLSLPAFAANGTMEGDGSEDNPYQIEDYADLKAFASKVNSGETGAWAVLMKDITAGGGDWTPIGKSKVYFGTFDGQGHVI